METFFPSLRCLHVLGPGSPYFLPALPSSLTELKARMTFDYGDSSDPLYAKRYLSALPRGLLSLTEVFMQGHPMSRDSAQAFFADLANCPPGLDILSVGVPHTPHFEDTSITTKSLPRGLSQLDLPRSAFSETVARALPPHLTFLRTSAINDQSFSEGNWAAHLPQTLLTLMMDGGPYGTRDPPLSSFLSSLPRSLTSISLKREGDWSFLSPTSWPPALTFMRLTISFGLAPSELSVLPTTLKTLITDISSNSSSEPKLLQLSLFPPNLTKLQLLVDRSLAFEMDKDVLLPHLASFSLLSKVKEACFPSSIFNALPSLTRFSVPRNPLTFSESDETVLLPRVTCLKLQQWHVDWIPLLPRTLRHLRLDNLSGIAGSPLLDGLLFRDLPTTLERFIVLRRSPDDPPGHRRLPDQDMLHLTSLRKLHLNIGWHISSSMFDLLPDSLTSLTAIQIEIADEEDFTFLPSRLYVLEPSGSSMNEIFIENAPLCTLSKWDLTDPLFKELAINRVGYAMVHP